MGQYVGVPLVPQLPLQLVQPRVVSGSGQIEGAFDYRLSMHREQL